MTPLALRPAYRLLLWAVVLAVSVGVGAEAQDADDPGGAVERFDRAAARHAGQFRQLLVSRAQRTVLGGGPGYSPCDRGWTGCDSVALSYREVDALVDQSFGGGPGATTGLLFYAADGADLDAWLLTPGSAPPVYVRVPGGATAVPAALDGVRRAMGVAARQRGRVPRFASQRTDEEAAEGPTVGTALRVATDLLLPLPIRDGLADLDALVVVPAGAIGTAPFAALRPFGPDQILADRLSVTVAPGLSDFVEALGSGTASAQRYDGWGWARRSLVVGNPAFDLDGEDPYLPPLAGAEAEARAVARVLGAEPVLGADARLDAVRQRADDADLLYVATHGAADPEEPVRRGGLFFADDAMWTVGDVLDAPARAKHLVVLSACQTGLGRAESAGVIGLARAFTLQGADHVAMSLWNVDDAATAFLMTRFMVALRTTCQRWACDVPAALRHATLEARARWPEEAALWASFVHFGAPVLGPPPVHTGPGLRVWIGDGPRALRSALRAGLAALPAVVEAATPDAADYVLTVEDQRARWRRAEAAGDEVPAYVRDAPADAASAAVLLAEADRIGAFLAPTPRVDGTASRFPFRLLGLRRASDGVVLRPDPATGVLSVPSVEVPPGRFSCRNHPEACYTVAIGATPDEIAAHQTLPASDRWERARVVVTSLDAEGETCGLVSVRGCGSDLRETMLIDLPPDALAPAETADGAEVRVVNFGLADSRFAFRLTASGRTVLTLLTTRPDADVPAETLSLPSLPTGWGPEGDGPGVSRLVLDIAPPEGGR